MREAIRNALIEAIPEVEERIFEPHTATPDTQKPYLIVREMTETDNTAWAGYRARIEVWPYCEQSSYVEVDKLAKKISNALDKQLLGTNDTDTITCIADGMSDDTVDKEWDALTRCVNFYVLALQPAILQGPIINDNWLTALAEWSKEKLSEQVADCYSGILPTGYKRPSILWRFDSMDVEECGALGFEVIKNITCHIFGRNAVEELNIAMKLIEDIKTAIKIPLDIKNRWYMTVKYVSGHFYTDALKQGQIKLSLARKVKRPYDEAPLMMETYFDGRINLSEIERRWK